MIHHAFQRDYGGFDSKFLGLTMRFEEPSLWELYLKCNLIGRDPKDVVRIGNEALRLETMRAFQIFSIVTTLIHEARHFHDSLLSPYGNHLFRIRINAAINGLQSIASYRKGRRVLPVPFSRWRQKTPTELTRLANYWEKIFKITEDPNPPILTGDELVLSNQTEKAYEAIKNLIINPKTERLPYSFQPLYIFEASGILAQVQNVYSVFGVQHRNLFLEVIFNSQDALRYTLPLYMLGKLFQLQQRPLDIATMSAIIHWSMMGDYTKDKYGACPTVRFTRLIDYLSKIGLPPRDIPVQNYFPQWTEKLKVTPIDQALENVSRANQKTLATLDELPQRHQDFFSNLIETFRSRVNSTELMKRLYLADNDSYIMPYHYQENISNWVAAPIRLDFVGPKLVSTEDSLLSVFDIRSGIKMDDGKIAVSRAIAKGQSEGVKLIDAEKAASTNDSMNLVDFCFSDFCRDEPDFDIARRTLRGEKMYAFELLD